MRTVFQRPLLVTEHTGFDTGAERLAISLAQQCQLPLAGVMPLVSNPEYELQAPTLAARAEQEAAHKIARVGDLARAQGVALDLRARRGPEPYREIVDEACERGSDLLVIRRRGQRSFLANLFLGEMVFKVIAHAPCSVLIVPREAPMWRRRVLVAAEPTARGEKIVRQAAALAAEFALPLAVVCVSKENTAQHLAAERFVETVVTAARQIGVTARGQVLEGQPSVKILNAVQQQGADLIVVGSHDKAKLSHAWVGSVAQKIIGLSEHPVLVAHIE